MTLFLHAVKNLKKDAAVNILTVLQLTAVIVITIIMVSSVLLRYRYYKPFRDILQSNGILCNFTMPANYDTEHMQDPFKYIADDEMKEFFPDIENVISCNHGPNWLVDGNDEPINANCMSLYYDDEIIERYIPEIKEGRWLNTSKNAQCIEAVISETDLGINVGDRVRIGFMASDIKDNFLDILIVGKLSENTKAVGYSGGDKKYGDIDVNSIYGTVSFAVERQTLFLLSSDYLSENTAVLQGIYSTAMITFSEDYPSDKIEQIRQKLVEYNCRSSYPLSEVNENSRSYILAQIKDLLPIIIVIMIMVIVNSISSSALSARRELKNFAIFYMTGLQWKHCALINLIQTAVTAAISVVLSVICVLALKCTDFGGGMNILIQWETAVGVAAIILLFTFTSLIMPFILLSRTTPKQILAR